MNEFLTFALSKKSVFGHIRLFTSYLAGKRASDAVEYDKVAAIEPDLPLLQVLMEEAATEMTLRLPEYYASLDIDGDIMRITLRNPFYGVNQEFEDEKVDGRDDETGDGKRDGKISAPDSRLLLHMMETFVTSETIHRWLKIVGYDFPDGITSARESAERTAEARMSSIIGILTPPSPKRMAKASPRRIPPM